MSIIVKEHWSGQILLYSKGADSTIFSNLANPDTGILDSDIIEGSRVIVGGEGERRRELTELHLTLYAKEGLRTLCMAKRVGYVVNGKLYIHNTCRFENAFF